MKPAARTLPYLVLALLAACIWPGNGDPYPGSPDSGVAPISDVLMRCQDSSEEIEVAVGRGESDEWALTIRQNSTFDYFLDLVRTEDTNEISYASDEASLVVDTAPDLNGDYPALLNIKDGASAVEDLSLICTRPE